MQHIEVVGGKEHAVVAEGVDSRTQVVVLARQEAVDIVELEGGVGVVNVRGEQMLVLQAGGWGQAQGQARKHKGQTAEVEGHQMH